MIETGNPYQAPADALTAPAREGEPLDKFVFVTWTVVFAINLIMPLLFAWPVTEEHGRMGMCVAVGLFLGAGWALCYARPSAARKLVIGSLFTGCSQLLPLLQIIAGVIALEVTEYFESAVIGDAPHMSRISSGMGGFLATLVVGGILLICAGGIGIFLSLLERLRRPAADAAQVASEELVATAESC